MTKQKRVNKFPKSKQTAETLKKSLNDYIPKNGYTVGSNELFARRVRVPKMKKGFKITDLKAFEKTKPDLERLYSKFFYDLLERMLFDFINGYDVVYDKKRNLRFHLWEQSPSVNTIKKLMTYGMYGVPSFDIRKTKYKIPTVMMDLGFKDKIGAVLILPRFFYSVFLDNRYEGITHTKSSELLSTPDDYWNKKRKAAEDNDALDIYFSKWQRAINRKK